MFANGFPTINMVLSLMLVGAVGYIAHPVRYIPDRMDQTDSIRITHGVFITRVIIFLIAFKELAEIYMGTWDLSIRQHNLLISTRGMKRGKRTIMRPSKFPTLIKLEDCTKKAIFNLLKELGTRLEKQETELEKKHDDDDSLDMDMGARLAKQLMDQAASGSSWRTSGRGSCYTWRRSLEQASTGRTSPGDGS